MCAVVGVLVSGPVVSAEPAKADSFADRTVSKTTADGWRVSVVKARERVRSVPPLNQSPWSREGFLSLRGEGRIAGTSTLPVNAGTVATGFQLGCNTDVTSGATVGVTGGPTAQMSISYPPAMVIGGQLMPSISTTLRPGTIADVPFGSKQMAGALAGIELDGVHVKVDGCLGPVAVRAYTRVAISTAANDTTVHVYGKPHYL
ncbi:MAG: MspA family porin [Gordonia sp. (in: high G+C Gram-positive bacteria)]|uniref:MspA family porin n=1 Tax=Gordonia sp. (in: high G+C Gram-positive bacteria) TaxID=84139 RepID=UPI0039E5EF2A